MGGREKGKGLGERKRETGSERQPSLGSRHRSACGPPAVRVWLSDKVGILVLHVVRWRARRFTAVAPPVLLGDEARPWRMSSRQPSAAPSARGARAMGTLH